MEQNFESFSIGNLNRQQSWSGSTSFQIVTSPVHSGGKSVDYGTTGNTTITGTMTPAPCARQVFWFYFTNVNAERLIGIQQGGNQIGDIRVTTGEIRLRYGATYILLDNSPTINTWYKGEIHWDANRGSGGQFRARINDGDWTAWVDPIAGKSFSNIDNIRLNNFTSVNGNFYVDDFSRGGKGGILRRRILI